MKLSEIIAHNKANLERCTKKQADCMCNDVPGLREDESTKFLFNSHIPGKPYKYVCICLCWSKDYDSCRCFIQFGFNNRNRLRNRLQHVQKNNDDIVCRVISINEETNEQK